MEAKVRTLTIILAQQVFRLRYAVYHIILLNCKNKYIDIINVFLTRLLYKNANSFFLHSLVLNQLVIVRRNKKINNFLKKEKN